MANLTLAEARTKTGQFLDDASNTRWTTAQVDDALTDALSQCLTRYAQDGGDRFDLEFSGTSSATDGTCSLSSVSPLWIKQVGVVVSPTTYRIPPKDAMRRGYADLNARSVLVLYVREYALSSTASDPLVGVGAVAANSWRAFDRWVCVEAAYQLGMKDLEMGRLQVLRAFADQCAKEALARPSTPSSYGIPRPEWSPLYEDLHWQFVNPSTLYFIRQRWR